MSDLRKGLKIFVVSFGGSGDIQPMIAVAGALRRRGHRVYFVSNPYFEPLARRLGLEFTGHGTAERFVRAMHGLWFRPRGRRLIHKLVSSNWFLQGLRRWQTRKRTILGSTRALYELIERHYVPGETVIVARGNIFGARIAQEKLGVPLATVHLQPAMLRSEYDAPGLPLPDGSGSLLRFARRLVWASIDGYIDLLLTPKLNSFRSELGLVGVRRPFSGWIHSSELVIGLFPDWFAPPQPDWPPNTHLTGFPLFDESGLRETPPEFMSFLSGGEPPVVFTCGSVFRDAKAFFETSLEVCRLSCRRGVFLTPVSDLAPSNLPASVRHFEYIPLSVVLPRAAAIVHHGGIGTTGLALAAGIPQLVVPFVDDQSDNAARVERLGVGVRLSRFAYRPAPVIRKLDELLRSEAVAVACRSIAARVRMRDPLAETCRLVEELGLRKRT